MGRGVEDDSEISVKRKDYQQEDLFVYDYDYVYGVNVASCW